MFMYIFTLLGMQLFANKLHFDANGYPLYREDVSAEVWAASEVPRENFDTFEWAFVTVFQILTGEDWPSVMFKCWRAAGAAGPFFFILVLVIGDSILLNLFLGVLLQEFESHMDDDEAHLVEGQSGDGDSRGVEADGRQPTKKKKTNKKGALLALMKGEEGEEDVRESEKDAVARLRKVLVKEKTVVSSNTAVGAATAKAAANTNAVFGALNRMVGARNSSDRSADADVEMTGAGLAGGERAKREDGGKEVKQGKLGFAMGVGKSMLSQTRTNIQKPKYGGGFTMGAGSGSIVSKTKTKLGVLNLPSFRKLFGAKNNEDEDLKQAQQLEEEAAANKAAEAAEQEKLREKNSPGLYRGGTRSAKGKIVGGGRPKLQEEVVAIESEIEPPSGPMHDGWVESMHDQSLQMWAAVDEQNVRLEQAAEQAVHQAHQLQTSVSAQLNEQAHQLQSSVCNLIESSVSEAYDGMGVIREDGDEYDYEDEVPVDDPKFTAHKGSKASDGGHKYRTSMLPKIRSAVAIGTAAVKRVGTGIVSAQSLYDEEPVLVAGQLHVRPSIDTFGGDGANDRSAGGRRSLLVSGKMPLRAGGMKKQRPTLLASATSTLVSNTSSGSKNGLRSALHSASQTSAKGREIQAKAYGREPIEKRWPRLECVLTLAHPSNDKPCLRFLLREGGGHHVPLAQVLMGDSEGCATILTAVADVPNATAIKQMRSRQQRLTILAGKDFVSSKADAKSQSRAADALRNHVVEFEVATEKSNDSTHIPIQPPMVANPMVDRVSLSRASSPAGALAANAAGSSQTKLRQRVRCYADSAYEKQRWLDTVRQHGLPVVEGEFEAPGSTSGEGGVVRGEGGVEGAARRSIAVDETKLLRFKTKQLDVKEEELAVAKRAAMDPELAEKIKTYKKQLYKILTGELPEVDDETGEVLPEYDPELLELEGWLAFRRKVARLGECHESTGLILCSVLSARFCS
jgi:hypothetical protein